MEACCSRFTAAEGGARLAAVAAERNTLAVEYSAFIATRLLHEDAYKIRGLLSNNYQRSVYVTRASRVACVAYELHILTDLSAVKALEVSDVEDWRRELEEKQVIVCTSQVLQWILQEGVLTIPQINVLIIDSCHLIFEDENLQYIMQRYKQCKETEQPRILALTYPLFTSGKDSELDTNDNNINNSQDKKTATSVSDINETDGADININKDNLDVPVSEISDKKSDIKIIDDTDDQYRIVEVYDDDELQKDILIKDKETVDEKENCIDSSSNDKVSESTSKPEIDREKDRDDKIEEVGPSDETKDRKPVDEKKRDDEKIEVKPSNEMKNSVDEKKDTTEPDKIKGANESKNETQVSKLEKVDEKEKNIETKDEKIDKDKKQVKSDFPGIQENLDDFDMYQKLEWKIEELERALCCQMDLAEDIDGGKRLANTVAKPKEILIEYKPRGSLDNMPEAYVELERYMREAVASAKAFMDEHRYDPTEIYGDELYEEFMNIPDPTIEPKLMFNQFLYVLDQLGPYAADKAAICLLVKLEKLKIKVPYERHFLLLCLCTSVFVKIRCQADLILSKYDDWEKISLFSTPKVLRFAEILEQFQTSEQIAKARDKSNTNVIKNKELNTVANIDDKEKGNDVSDNKYDNSASEERCKIRNDKCNIKSDRIDYDPKINNSEVMFESSKKIDSKDTDVILENSSDLDLKNQIESKGDRLNESSQERNQNNENENEGNMDDLENCTDFDLKTETSEEISQNCNKNTVDSSQKGNKNNLSETQKDANENISDFNNVGTKLVRSKTMELLDELEKCDFATLSNKIEDRVNTYEANLKDFEIDSIKISDEVGVIDNSNKVDKSGENSENDQVSKDLQDNQITKDSKNFDAEMKTTELDKTNDTNETTKDINDENLDIKNKTLSELDKINDSNKKTDKTTNCGNKSSESDIKHNFITESKSVDIKPDSKAKLDERLLELRSKFRRPRVRGRRPARSHARLQQMQQNPDALCGIVFVREALLAKIMFMVVVDMSRSRPSLSHLCAQYCAVESEGDDSRPQGKKHEDVLKKFRMHECNLLLATSALEEGIDLPRCNLVVRWDLPPSYRSHGLCRSRARAPRSAVALMAEAEASSQALLDNLSVYKELDQIISRKCGCGIQNEPPPAEEVHADIFTAIVKAYTPNGTINENTLINKDCKDNSDNCDSKRANVISKDCKQHSELDITNDASIKDEKILMNQESKDYSEVVDPNEGNIEEKVLENNDTKHNSDSELDVTNDASMKDEKILINKESTDSKIGDPNEGNVKEKVLENDIKHNSEISYIDNVQTDVKTNDSNDKAADDKVLSAVNSHNDKVNCPNNESDDRKAILKESVNGITKEVIRTEYVYKRTGSDKSDINEFDNDNYKINDSDKNTSIVNETLNKIDRDIPKQNELILGTKTGFNITYDLTKNSACGCKSVCKCKGVSGAKSEGNKAEKKEDGVCSVDLSTAIALINRYCGKLPSDTFTRLAPQYWMEAVRLPDKTGGLRTAYICTLRLPLNCPVKYNIVGHPMPTKVLARRMVALQACRILHRSGELDNQLMPIGKENFKAAELENVGQSDTENNDSARPGTTKRRQYYYKRTASAFTDCQPIIDSTDSDIEKHSWNDVKESYKARFDAESGHNTLYALSSRLWCALPERYNTRGRRLHAPQHAPHAVAVLMAARRDRGLQIPAFPVYTRSGEVRVSIEPATEADVRLSPRRAKLVRRFMRFVFSDVLRVRRRGMRLQTEGTTHNNYYIVPTVKVMSEDGTSHIDIDWSFLELIYRHTEEKKNTVEKPVLLQQDEEDDDEVVEKKQPRRERERDGKPKRMDNPFLAPGEVFSFDADKYRDAVVTPWYRNQDQPQYFLVAEICWNLTPDSAFPSSTHGSFRDYYAAKYGVTLTQPNQPLLDVDHTSARLNLLTPRYVNRKGVALPVSSERTRRAKRDRLDQKQILVPELCTVHPFAAPLWFATVALPCVLYRINALLIADEIRRSVSADVALGLPPMPGVPPPQWPPLDFGWSLAEVLSTDEKGEKIEKKKEEDDYKKGDKDKQKEDKEHKEGTEDDEKLAEVKEKTINDILQEKEDAESGFEIGTWSNDMASSIPQEYDEFMEPLPPNLTFCTSASGGANWSDPIDKPKAAFGASKTFSMAESDCSYLSSDFDTDDSDLNSEGSDEDTDSTGFCGKNTYAMGVRIEYKTAHEAEAVDVERKTRASAAPQPHAGDDALDVVTQRRLMRVGRLPEQYLEKYNNSVMKHKQDIKSGNLITKDNPIKEILPDNSKEMERLRKVLNIDRYKVDRIDDVGKIKDIDESLIEPESISNDNIKIDCDCDNSKNENLIIDENHLNSIDSGFAKGSQDCFTNERSSTKIDKELRQVNQDKIREDRIKINELLVKKNEASKKDVSIKIYDESIIGNEINSKGNLIELDSKSDEVSTKDKFDSQPKTMSSVIKDKEADKETATKDSYSKDTSIALYKKDIEASKKDKNSSQTTSDDHLGTVAAKDGGQKKEEAASAKDMNDSPTATDNKLENDFKTKLLEEIFPYGDKLEFNDGKVTLESIERNKRVLLKNLKERLTPDEVKKLNCFSMLDIDIDSPDYVNEKVVNVGFDTKDNYVGKVNAFRTAEDFTPYYRESKAQNSKEFDFDYQPDLEGHPGPSPSVILQALTMSNANDGINLERLETIGDSFLKFAITAYLYCAHPAVHEGKLSHMRSKQVSNLNLYRLGRNKRLGARMIASKFEPHDNWLPPCHKPPPTHHPTSGDQEMQMQKDAATDNAGCFIPYNLITQHSIPDKSIADCVEALIGAYLLECGPRGALLFMSWLGISVLPRHALPLPPDHPYVRAGGTQKPPATPSPKQSYASSSISCSSDTESGSSESEEEPEPEAECEWSWRGRPVGSLRPQRTEDGRWVQTIFGELRAPPSPLLRYVEDPEGELERMLSGYEALERTLHYRFRDRSLLLQALTHASHQQNRLTDCYQRLEFLGDAILDYLITRHLYEDARRHSPGALTDLRSALVNNTIFATLAARHGFHKYFRHMSPGLNEVLTKYVKIQEENGHSISEEHYLIQEDEMEQAEDVEVPKALGDLFESVAGAIFLDSGMSLGAVWASYVRLMGAELEAFSAAAPKSPVRELLEAEPDTAKFGKPERLADGRRVRVCVEVFGRGAFKGVGRNYRIAKGTAARCALRHLRAARPVRR